MPPDTLEEIFTSVTGKSAKLLEQIGNEIVETEIYNPEFVEWLRQKIKFYETIIPKEKQSDIN